VDAPSLQGDMCGLESEIKSLFRALIRRIENISAAGRVLFHGGSCEMNLIQDVHFIRTHRVAVDIHIAETPPLSSGSPKIMIQAKQCPDLFPAPALFVQIRKHQRYVKRIVP
jgi:hypothetical protein